jgi:beta-lactamase regulating signal transducer with metallopeptidase domain
MVGVIAASAARGAVVLVVALLLLAAMRRASAARRNGVMLGALAAQLLIPFFTIVPDVVAERIVPAAIAHRVGAIEAAIVPAAPRPAAIDRQAPTGGLVPDTRWPAARIALLVWAIGAAAATAWMIGARARVWWMTCRLVPLGSGPLRDAADAAARALGIRRGIVVLVSDMVRLPVTWGVARPRILLPMAATEWDRERLQLVMLHEAAHVRRRDALAQLVASVALVLFWFDPLMWIAARRLRATAERAADDMVMRAGVAPSSYVDTLLDFVRQLRHEPALGGTFAMARRGEFEGRMLAVLDERADRAPLGRRRATAWAATAIIAAALLGTVRGSHGVVSAAVPGAQETVSGLSGSLLTIAEHSGGDITTLEVLERAIASGALTTEQIDRYLRVVARMRRSIPRGAAIRALSGAASLDSSRLATTLGLVAPIESPIERSISLAAIARSQTLGASHRAQYYAVASTLSGPALTSALDAIR